MISKILVRISPSQLGVPYNEVPSPVFQYRQIHPSIHIQINQTHFSHHHLLDEDNLQNNRIDSQMVFLQIRSQINRVTHDGLPLFRL